MKDYKHAVWLIELVCRYHPCSVLVLLGDVEEPSSEDWIHLLKAERGGIETSNQRSINVDAIPNAVASVDKIDRIIKSMGGWENIVKASRSVMIDESTVWCHFADYLKRVEGRAVRPGDSNTPLQRVADEHHIHISTLISHRQWIPKRIARFAMAETSIQQHLFFQTQEDESE